MLNIINHQGKTIWNFDEVSLLNDCHQKDKKLQVLAKVWWRKGNPPSLLVGMPIDAVIKENGMEMSQKTKNRTIIWYSNSSLGYVMCVCVFIKSNVIQL